MKHLIYIYIVLIGASMALFTSCDDYSYAEEEGWYPSKKMSYIHTSASSMIFQNTESQQNISVLAQNTPWLFSGMADWLTVAPSSGNEDAMVSVGVTASPTADEYRTCQINLHSSEQEYTKNFPISITQKPAAAYITINNADKNIQFDVQGGAKTIPVQANHAYSVNCGASWVKATKSADNTSITIQAEPNPTAQIRHTTVILASTVSINGNVSQTINITQNAAGMTTTQSQIINQSALDKTYTMQIKADAAWTATNNDYSWLEVTPDRGNTGTTTVNLNVAYNKSTSARTGHISFYIGDAELIDITINQEGLYLNPQVEELTFDADACTRSLEVRSNVTWKVLSKPAWLTVTQEPITGTKTLSISAQNYNETTERSGEIIVGIEGLSMDKKIRVTQKARTFSNLIGALQFESKGETQPFDIETNGAWVVKSDKTWLTFSKTSGTGKSTIYVTAAENDTEYKRNAVIFVQVGNTEKTILVSQEAHFLTISPTTLDESLPSTGGRHTIHIASDDSWQTYQKASWIVVNPTSGNGDIDVTMTAIDNPSVNNRQDTVWINPKYAKSTRVIVKQAARYLRVSSTGYEFFSKGGVSEPILIETDGKYLIKTNADWLSIQETGKAFTLTATENKTGAKRSGKVTVELTDLKQGEAKIIELSIEQRPVSIVPTIEDFSEDEDWNNIVIGGSHMTITIAQFDNDEDWNSFVGGHDLQVIIVGFEDDNNWNQELK